ncbi:hypothetical protein CSB08_00580 [Candidatus Gracilibacteria bacterium]|nr:MAG: hypothetical protein CSB08_00580 [Candidatus Gracilibacteria bacterium]PIE84871.1 MAG: hypothetical protein CSA08_04915 [Candidatus Gracilibacteria bacterium]
MKNLFIILSLIFILSSCFTSPEDVQNAKKDMGIIKEKTIKEEPKNIEKNEKNKENITSETQNVIIKSLTEENFLKINEINYSDFLKGEAEISGETLEKIDKIIVYFKNESSEFPDDVFELKQFKPGDKNFVYRAHTKYRVLDFGVNEYIFEAYSGEKVSKTQVTVKIKKEEENKNEKKNEEEEDKNENKNEKEENKKEELEIEKFDKLKDSNLNLPSGGDFGHPISLGEDAFTYSDISGLEINKYSFSGELSCNRDTITNFLRKEVGSWFYWNTCRDILAVKKGEKTKAISFFVIRLDGKNYIYEKHFLDLKNGLYGKYEIEKGTGVNKENIADKNKKLKENNDNIKNIDIVNNLFKIIVK